jgi:hypothetical protein
VETGEPEKGAQEVEALGHPFLTNRMEEDLVRTFLMFLLQDNLHSRAACTLGSEVARDEAQRRAEASGGWGTWASPPTITRTRILGTSLQMGQERCRSLTMTGHCCWQSHKPGHGEKLEGGYQQTAREERAQALERTI